MGTKYLGTVCPGGPIFWGTICPWGPNVWGQIVLGTICPWGPNELGLFVLGDQLWGTKCPGTEWVRDQMRSSLLWLRTLQKSFIKHHWLYLALFLQTAQFSHWMPSYLRKGIILISTAWLILVLQIFYIRKFKAIFNHQKQTKVNWLRYLDEVYMIIIDFCHNFKSAVKSW